MNRRCFSLAVAFSFALSLMAENKSYQLNILDLGGCNDGSQDVSALINQYTEQASILLPAGIYRIDAPLRLKNSLVGEGYSRINQTNQTKTWLISHIDCADASHGVIEYEEVAGVNVENLNIQCNSLEDGIRIIPCRQKTATYISRVGIYRVGSCGIHIEGSGSRPVFMEDITIFGRGSDCESVGIIVEPADCRINNLEAMGIQKGLVVKGGYTYGCNLHLWTGVIDGNDRDGSWWMGTRGIVLSNGGSFVGSQIYPDTDYIVFEQKAGNHGGFFLSEILYYDDKSEHNSKDHSGRLFYAEPGATPNLRIDGGVFAVCGTDDTPFWMEKLYTPGQSIHNVLIRTDRSVCSKNIDVLCISDDLPDYTLRYSEKGWCKVADILDASPSGSVKANLSTADGASWLVSITKQRDGKTQVRFKAETPQCKAYKLKSVVKGDVMKIYLLTPDDSDRDIRFTTQTMSAYFRPVDYGCLRSHDFSNCYHEVE